jgi:hypothetical protein
MIKLLLFSLRNALLLGAVVPFAAAAAASDPGRYEFSCQIK